MTDRPITFSAPMVGALLAGRKTQTRRLVSPTAKQKKFGCVPGMAFCPGARISDRWIQFDHPKGGPFTCIRTPYFVGDRLYVREHWKTMALHDKVSPSDLGEKYRKGIRSRAEACPVQFLADGARAGDWAYPHEEEVSDGWKPGRHRQAMHMPRWASRLTLAVEDVRIERLLEMEGQGAHPGESDALAEGVHRIHHGDGDYFYHAFRDEPHPQNWAHPTDAFRELWGTLHTAEGERWEDNPFVVAISFRVEHGNIDQIARAA